MRRLCAAIAMCLLAAACSALPGRGPTGGEPAPRQPVRYVALGDSLATGAGAGRGYAERYADRIRDRRDAPVRAENLARDGWTSGDLLDAVRTDPAFAAALREADVVTVDIGGNDLLGAYRQVLDGTCGGDDCLHAAVEDFRGNWDAVVTELEGRTRGDTALVTMDLYNPYVASLQLLGLRERVEPFLDAVNEHIDASADARDLAVAPVHAAFNGEDGGADPVARGLIAEDGLHPSDEGHAVIADLLLDESG